MKILYAGSLTEGQTCERRLKALMKLGHNIIPIDYDSFFSGSPFSNKIAFHFGIGNSIKELNTVLKKKIEAEKPDLVWIDKGVYIRKKTLIKIKDENPELKLVHINPDDPFGLNKKGWKIFKQAIPFYDYHFVSREENLEEYKKYGAHKVFEYDRSFDPKIHKPIKLTEGELSIYKTEVGFIGTFAVNRADSILFLTRNGINVSIYGNNWEKYSCWEELKTHFKSKALFGDDYAKAISGMDIALHFLRKENRDQQDSRTFEIPACGTFMIAERSKKHEEFFIENKEAVFFNSNEELLEKVKYYLKNHVERKMIAVAGYRRCYNSGYEHENRLRIILDRVAV